MTPQKHSYSIALFFLLMSNEVLAAKNLSGIDPGGAILLVAFVGLIALSHALGLIFNVFYKNPKLHMYNLVLCILVSATLLVAAGSLGFVNVGPALWYFPIAWLLWILGRVKNTTPS
jgi:hypothetical protein